MMISMVEMKLIYCNVIIPLTTIGGQRIYVDVCNIRKIFLFICFQSRFKNVVSSGWLPVHVNLKHKVYVSIFLQFCINKYFVAKIKRIKIGKNHLSVANFPKGWLSSMKFRYYFIMFQMFTNRVALYWVYHYNYLLRW